MVIHHLHIENYRVYRQQDIAWGAHINLITGPNGAGKTNAVDAIHYLCMSRSFVTSTDAHAINRDATGFRIEGQFSGSIRPSIVLSTEYARGDGKKIKVNDVPLERLSDLIGIVPVVVLSPDDKKLTNEGPELRRSFLDAMISQVNGGYLRNLMDYRRVMRQRNRLLADRSSDLFRYPELLEPWNEQLVLAGSAVVAERARILGEFATYLESAYALMAGIQHRPSYEYKTFCNPVSAEEIEGTFRAQLQEKQERDIERGITSVGPHRDEIRFLLDDHELRRYGSQGQHRLFALALKLAQLHFFSDMLDDLPIFLLDDVFGDLDLARTEVLMQTLANHAGQTFITAANATLLDTLIDHSRTDNRLYHVENGNITTR